MLNSSIVLLVGIFAVVYSVTTIHGAAVEEELVSRSMQLEGTLETTTGRSNLVQLAENLTINEDCYQPKETGRCFALFRRYAFNVEKRECEEFIYGGCGGNKNNFADMSACEDYCLNLNATADGDIAATTIAADHIVAL